jgi:oligopeptide/dipeptide ABC transporter ATP-binding protein
MSAIVAGQDGGPALSVAGLSIGYDRREGRTVAVTDVSFSVARGEIFGLVGETGCGKSTVLRAIIGLLHPNAAITAGSIAVAGTDVTRASVRGLEALRRRQVAMIFQDPLRALNPVLSIGEQLSEGLRALGGITSRDVRKRVVEAMRMVGIPDPETRLRAFPHELSGGQRQRIAIAAAIIRSPELLLADEPTTALDVTIQDQILALLRQLCRDLGMSVVLVTHDIGVVAETCDRVGVMYAGRLVEIGSVASVLGSPSHPYTAALLASIPRIGAKKARLEAIAGLPPDPSEPIRGCAFAPRCGLRVDACGECPSRLEVHARGQLSACIRHAELTPARFEAAS